MSKKDKVENTDDVVVEPSIEKEGGLPSQPGQVNLDSIANDLSTGMPEVQEHAIEQEKISEDEKLDEWSHLKDVDGNSFDAAIHKTNNKGEPTTSVKGNLIKKPGRKPGQPNQPGSVVGISQVGKKVDEAEHLRTQARSGGVMAANLLMQIGVVAGGDEWRPRIDETMGLDEKMLLETAFADYFEATGKVDLPPGIVLTVAVAGYALPRFTMPKTQSRLSKAKKAVKQWFINRKIKKHGMKAEPIESEQETKKQTGTMEA